MKRTPKQRSKLSRYVLGLDFGTLSGRAVLVDVRTGEECATAVHAYRDGVIEEHLPGRAQRLPPDTALQNPADYLAVLGRTIPAVLRSARVRPEQVVGIGTDFTSCTMLPVTRTGEPLCSQARWRGNPHAWVKLWKHHAAQPEADLINATASRRRERFMDAYGGRYSAEWFFSKLLETVRAAPEVYAAAGRFIEAGDWLVWQLCGEEKRCVSAAGFKAMWVARDPGSATGWGYPSASYFRSLDPKLTRVVDDKLSRELLPLGARAGGLTPRMARRLGLVAGTPIATNSIDAHAAVPACGVTTPGKLVMIVGTSTCHLLVGEDRRVVEGVCGVVQDGVIPGYWGYEAGQAGVGDLFAWFVEQLGPSGGRSPSRRGDASAYELLAAEAARLAPGESGLLALDWWNGCRSVLMDADLSGLLVGATITTKPPEIYRALMEATAFGTRKIIEAFSSEGVAIREIYACGGLAQKNRLLMQIYADVTGRPIRIAASEQTCAVGAAMHAAVAAGVYPSIHEAARDMARVEPRRVEPNPRHRRVYDLLYREYSRLHDYFGRTQADTMKTLKKLRRGAREKSAT